MHAQINATSAHAQHAIADVERSLIATAIENPDVLDQAGLAPSAFEMQAHQQIWALLQALRAQDRPWSTETVALQCLEMEQISKTLTVSQYIASLTGFSGSIATAMAAAGAVKEAAMRRELTRVAQRLMTAATSQATPPAEAATLALEEINRASDQHADRNALGLYAHEAADRLIAELAAGAPRSKIRIACPVMAAITGAVAPGSNIVLAAATGGYKSAFAAQLCLDSAARGAFCAIISQEMRAELVAHRMLSNLSLRHSHKPLTLGDIGSMSPSNEAGMRALKEARDALEALGIHICDKPGMTVDDVRLYLRALERQTKRKLDLVVIDYLGLLTPAAKYRGNKTAEVANLSTEIKRTALQFQCVTLTLHQFNRSAASRDDKRPKLSDLKDSSQIEQDADQVWFLYREVNDLVHALQHAEERLGSEPSAKVRDAIGQEILALRERIKQVDGVIELLVRKNRTGRTGEVVLSIDPAHSRISPLPTRGPF